MLVLLRIVLIVYIIAINVYSFILLRFEKNESENEGCDCDTNFGKLFVAGLLGGALAIYLAMFIYKFKLANMFLMVSMPVLIVVNGYFVINCFVNNFGFIL